MFYTVALFAHILGVLGLFLAMGLELTCMLRLRRAQSVEQFREWTSLSRLLDRVFPITTLLLLAGGVSMVIISWGWTTGWIDVSLVVVVLASVLGPTVNGRRLGAIHAEAASAPVGPAPTTLTDKIQDPVLWSSVLAMVASAIGVVVLMTFKPGWVGALVIIVVAILVGLIAGFSLGQPRQAPAARPQPQEQTLSQP